MAQVLEQINHFIYHSDIDRDVTTSERSILLGKIDTAIESAFQLNDETAKLLVHRVLYTLNLAQLDQAWEKLPKNINHPLLSDIKYRIESAWQAVSEKKYAAEMAQLPSVESFPTWIRSLVDGHKSNELHPVFTFLRDDANYEQMREFFFQETPLEMLFGDIVGFMLPGTYGETKVELVKNYWDEVGRAVDQRVHRNMRGNLMDYLHIPRNCYQDNIDLLVVEELELINMYLSLAENRSKLVELIGTMLATELMIPGRFQYLIDGWRRLGINDDLLAYHIEHTSVDEVHADDLLDHVTMPILQQNPNLMGDIVMGVMRRLDATVAVLDRLHARILETDQCCIDDIAKSAQPA